MVYELIKEEMQVVMLIDVKKSEKMRPACLFTARAVVLDRSSCDNPVSSSLPLPLHRSSGGDGPLERWPCCQLLKNTFLTHFSGTSLIHSHPLWPKTGELDQDEEGTIPQASKVIQGDPERSGDGGDS